MNTTETPEITTSVYGNTTGCYTDIPVQWQVGSICDLGASASPTEKMYQRLLEASEFNAAINQVKIQQQPMANDKVNRRIVQVFIADPNENVPLVKSVLYTGEQKLTDLNDTELFFEIPIAEKLKVHNEMRVKQVDREASKRAGKDVFLDPAKIRDLKMVVVTVAQF